MNEAERDRPRSVSCRVAHVLPLRSHCFYTAARGVSMVRGAGWKNIPKQFTCCVKNVAPSLKASQQVKSCRYILSYVIQHTFSAETGGKWHARWSVSTGMFTLMLWWLFKLVAVTVREQMRTRSLSLGGGISGWSPDKDSTAGANES